LISKELLLRFHKMIGQNLGEHFSAIPGRFREHDVIVGKYRCPDHRDVPLLIEKYCGWLRTEFKYESGQQRFDNMIIQAIVAHVYLEWIHPFGDGNGRTGRLVEFYILSRGGSPDIALHILSNHYNATRPEYYRQLEKAYDTRSLSAFLEYALIGFRDGLMTTLEIIQKNQLDIAWQKFVYDSFNAIEMKQKEVFKRRRALALSIPIDKKFKLSEIPSLSIPLAQIYSPLTLKTLERDMDELEKNKLVLKDDGKYFANIAALNRMIARRRGLGL
jgi:Fic family protein